MHTHTHIFVYTCNVYVFYIGHVDKNSLNEALFYCTILSKHHHHHNAYRAPSVDPEKNTAYTYI
jgi:hypothetical protein